MENALKKKKKKKKIIFNFLMKQINIKIILGKKYISYL